MRTKDATAGSNARDKAENKRKKGEIEVDEHLSDGSESGREEDADGGNRSAVSNDIWTIVKFRPI